MSRLRVFAWLFRSRTAKAPTPEVGRFRYGGRDLHVEHWTAAEWDRLPATQRPDRVIVGDRGSRYRLVSHAWPEMDRLHEEWRSRCSSATRDTGLAHPERIVL
jgi:hypothetical protein